MLLSDALALSALLQCVLFEGFFYFGWNQHAIPSIASLSFSEFMYSQSVKGLTVGVQLLTMIFCGWLINKCTALNFSSVVAWEVSKNFGLLCIACAAQFIFCYATLVPHYNFNVELMVKAFEHGSGPQDDTSFWSYFGTQVRAARLTNPPLSGSGYHGYSYPPSTVGIGYAQAYVQKPLIGVVFLAVVVALSRLKKGGRWDGTKRTGSHHARSRATHEQCIPVAPHARSLGNQTPSFAFGRYSFVRRLLISACIWL